MGRKIVFYLIIMALLVIAPSASLAADEIKLNADRVDFDEASGIATAEGKVTLSKENLHLAAPFLEYDIEGSRIKASGNPDGNVVMILDNKKLTGEQLYYDLNTRRGVLKNASGQMEGLYLSGKDIEVSPLKDAKAEGWLSSKGAKGTSDEELAARWLGVRVTTCSYSRSHYRLQAKEVVVIPGKRIIVRQPQVYLGEHMLFKYPFDYVLQTTQGNKKSSSPLLPSVAYESAKGAGIGFGGPIVWDSGYVNLNASAWTKNIWEAQVDIEQSLGQDIKAFGKFDRLYDKDTEEAMWRPQWGLSGAFNNVDVKVRWAQRELITKEIRAGVTRRYSVWTEPELSVNSRWFKDRASGLYARLGASYGRFSDNYAPQWSKRWGGSLELYGEPAFKESPIKPFIYAKYNYYNYPDNSTNQQTTYVEAGFRTDISKVSLKTSYVRRWISGFSPMFWDSEDDREDIYQEVRFPIARNATDDELWYLTVRGGYDLKASELGEMVYKVTFDQHCLNWELLYKDDLRGNDSWVGLNFVIKQYPQQTSLSTNELFEPGKRPDDLPLEKGAFNNEVAPEDLVK